MPNRYIKNVEYELVQTLTDDLRSSNILQTIVEEGQTPVSKYRLNLGSWNPKTMVDWQNAEQIEMFCLTCPENFWSLYFEDPVEEESE